MKSAVTFSCVAEAKGGPFVFWDDFNSAARQAIDIGFDAIEIFAPDATAIHSLDIAQFKNDLPVAAVGTGAGWLKHRLTLSSPESTVRQKAVDYVKSMMQVASHWQASTIIGSMQGRSDSPENRDEYRSRLRESLGELDVYAAQLGCTILYEPLNRYETDLANTVEEGIRLIKELHHTKLLADLFHMNIEESDIVKSIQAGAEHIGHIHWADTNRQAMGFGHLDSRKIANELTQIGYSGFLSAEVFARPDSVAAARQTKRSYTVGAVAPTYPHER